MTLANAKTIADIISLIHVNLTKHLSGNKLHKIAQAILVDQLKSKGQALPDPLDLPVSYVYDPIAQQITKIDCDGETFQL